MHNPTILERFWAKVALSDEDCWLWTAARLPRGYGRFVPIRSEGIVLAHRYSYALHHGPIPDGKWVDHLCFNPPCVRPDHLQAVTPKQNGESRGVLHPRNLSGYRGVSSMPGGKWRARVKHNGVEHMRSPFDTPAEAAKAAEQMRIEMFTNSDRAARAALANQEAA